MAADGGPAFGATIRANPGEYACGPAGGLSVLDYFAGQALAQPDLFMAYRTTPDILAKYAYDLAEAMLAERERRMNGDV